MSVNSWPGAGITVMGLLTALVAAEALGQVPHGVYQAYPKPATLDDLVDSVRHFKEQRIPNRVLAEYLSGVIDRRITNLNSKEGTLFILLPFLSAGSARFDAERDKLEFPPGTEYEARARWAWNNGFGCCAETACIAYYVLKRAGIPCRLIEQPGHAFVLVGLAPNAQVGDARTWGDDTYIVDGWFGSQTSTFRAAEWIDRRENSSFGTNYWGKPVDPRRSDETDTFDAPKRLQKWQSTGVLAGSVVYADGRSAGGAQITVRSTASDAKPQNIVATANGTFTTGLPGGDYDVQAVAPASANVAPAVSGVSRVRILGGRAQTQVTLTLRPPGPTTPEPPMLVTVPNVVGYPVQAAVDELRKVDLSADLVLGKNPPANRKPNVVVGQEPEAGAQVAPQSKVAIVFYGRSGEKEPQVAVPNVVRMLKEEAEQAIKAAELNPNAVGMKVDRPPNARPKEVYEQSPEGQQMAAKGQIVTFHYYAGIKVPDVVGMRRQEAEQTITRLLLEPKSEPGEKQAPNVIDAGNVYEQRPAGGEFLVEGEPVHIKFYKELGGFQDGDGALVDPRFAAAFVFDSKAGARSAIGYDSRIGDERKHIREYFSLSIIREPDSGQAQKMFESVSEKFRDYTSHHATHRTTIRATRVGPWDVVQTHRYWEADNPHLYPGAEYYRVAVHRDFWIFLRMGNPDENHDFGDEPNQIMAKSIKLIDLRFPPEGVK